MLFGGVSSCCWKSLKIQLRPRGHGMLIARSKVPVWSFWDDAGLAHSILVFWQALLFVIVHLGSAVFFSGIGLGLFDFVAWSGTCCRVARYQYDAPHSTIYFM